MFAAMDRFCLIEGFLAGFAAGEEYANHLEMGSSPFPELRETLIEGLRLLLAENKLPTGEWVLEDIVGEKLKEWGEE